MRAKNIQELIELLQSVEDKTQAIHVWDRDGYYGSYVTLDVDEYQAGNPLIIEHNEE